MAALPGPVHDGAAGSGPTVLPAPVRLRVLALAADVLRAIPEPEVPAALRAVRRFTPAKQLRLGGTALAVALETDDGFRSRVAEHVRDVRPELADALEAGTPPVAADPVDLAAAGYLLRSSGWERLLARAGREVADAAAVGEIEELARLRRELDDVRAGNRTEIARMKAELAEVRAEAEDLRRRLRTEQATATRSAAEAAGVREQLERRAGTEAEAAAQAVREAEAETRRWRARATDAEAAVSTARRAAREARDWDTVRLRVLLDTVLAATAGLRRELDLPPVVERPGDAVAAATGALGELPDPLAALFAARGRATQDASLIDGVLGTPSVHLLIDGYNVTKTGYPDATLEAQRTRLVAGLGGLAARNSGAEITVVFDGTAATTRPTALPMPRGVRVLFSAVGELADELLVRLVRAEPAGRPLAVVTNDGEVAAAVRTAGARTIASEALVARLERS